MTLKIQNTACYTTQHSSCSFNTPHPTSRKSHIPCCPCFHCSSESHQVEERMRRLWLIRYKAVSSLHEKKPLRTRAKILERFFYKTRIHKLKTISIKFNKYFKNLEVKIQTLVIYCLVLRFLISIMTLICRLLYHNSLWEEYSVLLEGRLFCIQKAAPPKIPSECETNQLTMHRIQQTKSLSTFKISAY